MTEATRSAFELAALLADAELATGLTDFGDERFLEPLSVLLASLHNEANLTVDGQLAQRQRILDLLINRLRVENCIKCDPEILHEVVHNPVVIVGLPRTGTTMLHRIMASDTRFYAPLWYEVRYPAPFPNWDFKSEDPRIAVAEAEVAAMVKAAPELAAIHPIDATGADEEILLLEHSFISTTPEAFANVPSYGNWLAQHDNSPAYEYLRRCLQFLQWQKKKCGVAAQRWLLKTPHHLHCMALLLKFFPAAQIIQTHRDPLETIPSISSFHLTLRRMASDAVDAPLLARQWSEKFARGMSQSMATRAQHESQFIDIWYKDTVSKPLLEVQKVYDFIGMELTQETRQLMERWREENSRTKREPHDYSMAAFGMSEQQLKVQFAEYRQRFIESRP